MELKEILERFRENYLTESPDGKGLFTHSITHDFGTLTLDDKAYKKSSFYLLPKESAEKVITEAYEAGEKEGIIQSGGLGSKEWWRATKQGYQSALQRVEKIVYGMQQPDVEGDPNYWNKCLKIILQSLTTLQQEE